MLIYWAIFAFFAIGAVADVARPPNLRRFRPGWLIGAVAIIVMIGFRYEVGADWETYGFIFSFTRYLDFWEAIGRGDPAYQLLNWVVAQLDGEVVWVNLVCAILFTWGLFRLARTQPYPWLAVLVAVPYMVLVASMYTRQAAALGVLMAGLAVLVRGGSMPRFIIYVLIAASFHRTAVAVLPLIIFSRPSHRFLNIVGGLAACYLLFDAFLADSMASFAKNYLEREYNSQGAAVRIAMEVLAASIFLIRRKDFGFPNAEDRMWFNFALASFAALLFLAISPSSTAVDRLSLYLMPLQLVILSRLPLVYAQRYFGTLLVVTYCFAIQFVWLNFAAHAKYWIPYQFYPLFL